MYFLSILVAALCALPASAAIDPAAQKPKAVVFAEPVKAAPLFDLLNYPARAIPQVNTTILADADGIVGRILAPLGQRVSKRQRIMAITHTDPVYQYAPLSVLAPVGGIVSSVDVTEGSQVIRGQKLASVTDPSKVRLTVEVPAEDLPLVGKDQTGEFKIMGREEVLPVRVRGISPFVDPATGTATCELELADFSTDPVRLAPGMLGEVSFKANQHSGVSIPDSALFYRGSDIYVRVLDGMKAMQVKVSLGKRSRGNVEILKGLSSGAVVIQRTSRYIADGEEVTVEGKAD